MRIPLNCMWAIVVVVAILGIGVLVLETQFHEPRLTYNFCCGGEACSDTYYDNTTNECVLTQCISNPLIGNKSLCRYPSTFSAVAGGLND